MITPLANESAWLPLWDAAEPWVSPPHAETLVIAPHPDDETLGAGGYIASCTARGRKVVTAAVSDGENAYDIYPGLAAVRREEQSRALAVLGVPRENIIRLGLTDSAIASNYDELVQRLLSLVSGRTHILAPWPGDFHPDHEACGRAAEQVSQRTGAALTFYFFWTWHRGTPALLDGLPIQTFALSEAKLQAKTAALAEHRSQLSHPSGEPILPEYLLWPARRHLEVFLPHDARHHQPSIL